MHKRVVFNLGKFKSRKCSISFSRDYTSQGEKNKKALKIKAFRGYIFFIALIWLRRRVSAVSALRRLGRASSLDSFHTYLNLSVSRFSREPTVIRAFRETRRRNKKITDSQSTIRYFWLRRRDLNPRPFGP